MLYDTLAEHPAPLHRPNQPAKLLSGGLGPFVSRLVPGVDGRGSSDPIQSWAVAARSRPFRGRPHHTLNRLGHGHGQLVHRIFAEHVHLSFRPDRNQAQGLRLAGCAPHRAAGAWGRRSPCTLLVQQQGGAPRCDPPPIQIPPEPPGSPKTARLGSRCRSGERIGGSAGPASESVQTITPRAGTPGGPGRQPH
jgi:hypothetical protein